MEREEHPKPEPADKEPSSHAGDGTAAARPAPSAQSPNPQSPPPPEARSPEEKAKRTKHSRVYKRERELYGLVTPVFLPLLDAKDTPKHERKQQPKPQLLTAEESPAPAHAHAAHATPMKDADTGRESRKSRREHADMEGGGAAGGSGTEPAQLSEAPKKSRRASSTVKKSALRQTNASRPRRKRVSLVVDGQTVLPADTVTEPALTSPSSEATSTSNSTASLDDLIDPRLTTPDPHIHTEHHDAMHHSLPLPMSNNIHSPTKPLVEPSSIASETTPAYNPPQTVVDPYPTSAIPHATIADSPLLDEPADYDFEGEESFNTYVGGLHGSGIDDVEQAGSYGYPSSLGASYLESYMQSRPLRVRMEAADKAGLDEREKKAMMSGGKVADDEKRKEREIEKEKEREKKQQMDVDEDMDIMGEMEGF